MDEKVIVGLVAGCAAIIGGLIASATNIYVARRTLPFSRVRLKADLEILASVRQLKLDDTTIAKWIQDEMDGRYELSPHRKD